MKEGMHLFGKEAMPKTYYYYYEIIHQTFCIENITYIFSNQEFQCRIGEITKEYLVKCLHVIINTDSTEAG